jgi:hypothetical protein
MRPHQISNPPDAFAWLVGLAGFALMFLIFMRFPKNMPVLWVRIMQSAGWITAILLLFLLRFKDGSGFSLYRSDIIIIVLTNSFFFAALIWLVTRKQHMVRLAILAALLALRLSHGEAGWTSQIWDFSPIPWLYKLYYAQYLFIVIPGTIIGDYLLNWMQTKEQVPKTNRWTPFHLNTLVLTSVMMIIVHLIGLQARWLWQTLIAAVLLSIFLYAVLPKPRDKNEQFIYQCLAWATALLLIGHCLEPFEGGIKKDHSTLSYYFISAALAIYLLLTFFVFIDVLSRSKPFKLLIVNGQNPMIAYVAFANFIWPLLALSGLESLILQITGHPWLGFLRGALYTAALALLVSYFTHKRIFWRT